jgi:hypothetical protein
MTRTYLSFFFFLLTLQAFSQLVEKSEDLSDKWESYENGRLVKFSNPQSHSIHFTIDDSFRGKRIVISDTREYGVFINGTLHLRTKGDVSLDVDSLLDRYSSNPLLSIYSKSRAGLVETHLVYSVPTTGFENTFRTSNHFLNFSILGSIILLVFIVLIYRTNPSLVIDYLNVVKLISVQERDEAIVAGRIGSSANLIFFWFISLLTSFVLICELNGGSKWYLSSDWIFKSLSNLFYTWAILSIIIFLLLIAKLFLIWILSGLFGFKDVVRFQFFSFVRSLYISIGLASLLGIYYFISPLNNPQFFRYLMIVVFNILGLNSILLFFKLMTRTSTSSFHLFSYLWGSEIIPLMILMKVLLF